MTRKIAVVGATSAIARQCVRLWLEEEASDVTLVGRDARRFESTAADMRVRSPGSAISVRELDLVNVAAIEQGVADLCEGGAPDIVLIAHGSLPEQAACQDDLRIAADALQVNALSPALFAEAFAKQLQKAGRGTLVVIGSVAGDRGRRKNYTYGAAKALVDRYVEGLQHRFAGSGVRIVLAKPGPTDTPMTAHMDTRGMASAADVAKRIVEGARRGQPVIYAPAKWRLIMFVIRHLPRRVFDRLDI
ncbi:SDR family NAD(P)-dependent oxidoreductase [Ramlibacter sp. PS4R-6]|uniref:SDR family NAD(P)-dependent oxidoreductase n=1 Tax=Ramlibacter sp. PS4R-6 TaxID=3133438 RepID=UPI0030B71588